MLCALVFGYPDKEQEVDHELSVEYALFSGVLSQGLVRISGIHKSAR